MQTKPLAAHVVAAPFQLRERTMPITLDTVTELLGAAPKTDVRATLSALHKEGVVDVTRMRLTLRGLALGSALARARPSRRSRRRARAQRPRSGAMDHAARPLSASVARAWVSALNVYWTVPDEVRNGKVVQKQTVSADVRANSNLRVFDPEYPGLRALLALSVKELNESQYTFFRYATLELVLCEAPLQALIRELRDHSTDLAAAYIATLPQLAAVIASLRQDYLAKGQEAALRRPETKMQMASVRAVASARDESPDSAQSLFEEIEREAVRKKFEQFLHEAVGNAMLESARLAESLVAVSHA